MTANIQESAADMDVESIPVHVPPLSTALCTHIYTGIQTSDNAAHVNTVHRGRRGEKGKKEKQEKTPKNSACSTDQIPGNGVIEPQSSNGRKHRSSSSWPSSSSTHLFSAPLSASLPHLTNRSIDHRHAQPAATARPIADGVGSNSVESQKRETPPHCSVTCRPPPPLFFFFVAGRAAVNIQARAVESKNGPQNARMPEKTKVVAVWCGI